MICNFLMEQLFGRYQQHGYILEYLISTQPLPKRNLKNTFPLVQQATQLLTG